MEQSSLDTNIDNYSVSDILDLLELDDSSSQEERTNRINTIISDMQQANKTEIAGFFIRARAKLLEDTDEESEEEESEESEESGEEDIADESNAGEGVPNTEETAVTEPTILSGKDRWELPAPSWYLNAAATRTITQDMSVDTRFRPNYYTTLSTNFTIDLPEPQKKVVSMRISAIEMPMTYYSISNGLGNNAMLILSDSSTIYDGTTNNKSVTDADITYCDINGNYVENFNPVRCAWLVHVSDGNYDTISWMNPASRAKGETAINEAISLAKPGAIDEMGKFCKFMVVNKNHYLNSNFEAAVDNSETERQDIRFAMNKINGKSVFSTPQPRDIISGEYDSYITSDTNRRRISTIRFNVDSAGNLDTDTDIKLRLGWTLGFRAAEYVMGRETPVTTNTPISAVSEGTGFITGPRYAFLSIEDYLNNSRPSFIVAYGNYTNSDNFITRINLGGGGYHNLSTRDAGLTGHANRTREYYGPVDIQRLTIKLQDEYGRIIDINNMDWSFTVTFKKLYN